MTVSFSHTIIQKDSRVINKKDKESAAKKWCLSPDYFFMSVKDSAVNTSTTSDHFHPITCETHRVSR